MEDEDHPTREQVSYHPVDDRLRAAGFAIYARPIRGNPKWKRGDAILTENEALRAIRKKNTGGAPGKKA